MTDQPGPHGGVTPRVPAPRAARAGGAGLLAALVAALLLPAALPAAGADRRPLAVEGRDSVFQRVLPRPGTELHDSPGGAVTAPVAPLLPLYVYGRQEGWTEIGRSRLDGPEGWIESADAVPWRQNIVAAFSNPAGRERQLMFADLDSLLGVVRHESPISMARELRRTALEGGPGAAEGVVSIEPAEHVDINENFYLFPILDYREEEHPMTFEIMRALHVVSLPLHTDTPLTPPENGEPPSVGVVFVIDTTRSMEPYIEATRSAVRDIVGRLQESEAGARIRFGIIGFRDSPEAARAVDPDRDIGYRTREFLAMTPGQTAEDVLGSFGEVAEAEASTVGYAEDAMSGIWEALTLPGWETGGPDGGPLKLRYVVVISDASPKSPTDESLPEALRGQDWDNVRTLAAQPQTGITLMAMHLRSPDGRANHRQAETAYRAMTLRPDGRDMYMPVEIGTGADPRAAFAPVIDGLVSDIETDMRTSTEALRAEAAERELSALEEASLAMRLAWLGRETGAGAPPLIEAWALDRALENPLRPALDFRLLVTKNQLATMADVMREIVSIGDQTQSADRAGDFFEMLRGAVARMAQDPDALLDTEFETLDQAIGDFLQDLPYESPFMSVTAERWSSMGTERIEWLERARARLQLYEYFHDDPANWTALYEGQPEGEQVFAMPLEALP